MWKLFLQLVISGLSFGKVGPTAFQSITAWVVEAEGKSTAGRKWLGAEKLAWVQEQTAVLLPRVAAWIINMAISMAIGYAANKGLINKPTTTA